MTDNTQQDGGDRQHRYSFRLTDGEHQRTLALMRRLMTDSAWGKYDRMTQKRLFLEALDALDLRLNDLERKRKK